MKNCLQCSLLLYCRVKWVKPKVLLPKFEFKNCQRFFCFLKINFFEGTEVKLPVCFMEYSSLVTQKYFIGNGSGQEKGVGIM
jgi:hypothetical protein